MRKKRDKLGYKVFIRHDYEPDKLKDLLKNDNVKLLGKNFSDCKCLECGKEFVAQHRGVGASYCGGTCRNKASRRRTFDRRVEEEIARRKKQGLL